MSEYTGPELRVDGDGTNRQRRATDTHDTPEMQIFPPHHESSIMVLVQLIHQDVVGVKHSVTNLDKKLDQHMRDETIELAEAIASIMNKSFPEGDPAGHRATHEANIQAAKDKAEFWKKMRFELSRAGLLAFLLWVGVQIWKGALAGPSS